MEHAKLMTPLFYGQSFNREGRKMRAVFEREVSNGTVTCRIWRGAGKHQTSYPRAENDKYLLYVEVNGYLLPLRMTDFFLVTACGRKPAEEKLYGGMEKRSRYFDNLRETEGETAVLAALDVEEKEVIRYGNDPVRQANYIQRLMDEHVNTYCAAKENGGKTFPDFAGAAIMGELAECVALSDKYKAVLCTKYEENVVRAAEEDAAYCAEQSRLLQEEISAAVQINRNGGVLQNETVKVFRSKYDYRTYSIVNYLMRLYHVEIPLRTQGWINEKLVNVTIQNGKCARLQYRRTGKTRSSQKFFDYMDDLIRTVIEQPPEQSERKDVA